MSPDVDLSNGIACPECGQTNPDGWIVCGHCRAPLAAKRSGEEPIHGTEPETPVPEKKYRHHRPTHPLALASLACGVVGIFAPAGILAIIFGHVAQVQIRRDRQRVRGRDVAKLGLLLGYAGVAVFASLLFGFKYAYLLNRPVQAAQRSTTGPTLVDEKYDPYYRAIKNRPALSLADRENKGVTLLKAIQQSQQNYKSAHPKSGYTCALEDLFESGFDAGMIQLSIDTGYTLSITGCNASPGLNTSYRAFAAPPAGAGNLLCADDKGVIRSSNSSSNDACLESGKPIAIQ